MSASLNMIHLIGHIGVEPEMRYLESGRPVTRLRLATDRPVARGREPQTDWHDVFCWDQTAEFANEYLDVGRLVYVAGRLIYRVREIDGQQRRFAEIVAREIVPLDRRSARSDADEDEDDFGDAGDGHAVPLAPRPSLSDAA